VIERISAVTLAVRDMAESFRFYASLGFVLHYGGADSAFTSFRLSDNYLNLELDTAHAPAIWGRIVFYVSDVDAIFARVRQLNLSPSTEPRDAEWGERYFHISDPDGHELSFARLLRQPGA
jgi:catechol 2,3-dioxygenase-like lactoylglutathione lyase family enzyme